MSDRLASARSTPTASVVWAAVVALLAVFAVIAYQVVAHGKIAVDIQLLTWLHAHQAPALTSLARVLSHVGEPPVLGGITGVLVVALALRRRWGASALFALQVGGAAALDLVLKAAFARPRPTAFPHLVHESNFSFPSGHAVGGLAFFLALHLLLQRMLPRAWRWVGWLGVALAFAIGASRPYVQVHYPSDVLAGWALGAAWVVALQQLLARRWLEDAPS